jgi:hypothetical protein
MSQEEPKHGWLDAPWSEPARFAGHQLARSRGIYRKIILVMGVVIIASSLLPWREHYKWILVSATAPPATSHLYVSFSSTMGLAVAPWGTLVGLLGAGIVVVALRMVPDRRGVGITMTVLSAAALACCIIAMIVFEREFVHGLSAAAAWGACGGASGTTCFSLAGRNPLRNACGVGAFLSAGAACAGLIASALFWLAARDPHARSPRATNPIVGAT